MRTIRLTLLLCVLALILNGRLDASPQKVSQAKGAASLDWPTLKRVEGDGQIAALQFLLRAKGVRIAVDGIFSAPVEQAVKRFQRSRGLKPDGVAGPKTLQALIVPLRRGSRGDVVRALQTLLNSTQFYYYDYGHQKLAVDGVFGAQTEKDVRRFLFNQQSKANIVGVLPIYNGVVAQECWSQLFAATTFGGGN